RTYQEELRELAAEGSGQEQAFSMVKALAEAEAIAQAALSQQRSEEEQEQERRARETSRELRSEQTLGRWLRVVAKLQRRTDDSELKHCQEAWRKGSKGWQAISSDLRAKLSAPPQSKVIQEIERHCEKGDRRLQAMEDTLSTQGIEMANATRRAAAEFRKAQGLWE
ncbi:unnamed protein product, partial [Polarella glacialis]